MIRLDRAPGFPLLLPEPGKIHAFLQEMCADFHTLFFRSRFAQRTTRAGQRRPLNRPQQVSVLIGGNNPESLVQAGSVPGRQHAILAYHLAHHILKAGAWFPAQPGFGFRGVAQQRFHLCGAEIAGIHPNHDIAGLYAGGAGGEAHSCKYLRQSRYVHLLHSACFVRAGVFPPQSNAQFRRGYFDEPAHGILSAGGDDEIFGLVLLQHEPLHFHIVTRVSPVAQCVEVAQMQTVVQPERQPCQSASDFAGDKGFTPDRRFVVEEDAVAGIHIIRFPIIYCNPISVQFGARIGRTGIERRCFRLGNFPHQAVQFGSGSLIETGFVFQTENAYGFQQAQRAQTIHVGGIHRRIEGNLHVTLGREVINFIRLHFLNNADEICGVCQVAVMQYKTPILGIGGLVEMIDALGVEEGRAPLDAVHFIAFVQQQFGQIGSVLTGDTGDDRFFHRKPYNKIRNILQLYNN